MFYFSTLFSFCCIIYTKGFYIKVKDKSNLFAKNLKKYRNKKGLSQSALAKAINIDRTAISNFENNKREPTISTLIKICQVLEIDFTDLLGPMTNGSFISDYEVQAIKQYEKLKEKEKQFKTEIVSELDYLNDVGLEILLSIANCMTENDWLTIHPERDEIFLENLELSRLVDENKIEILKDNNVYVEEGD